MRTTSFSACALTIALCLPVIADALPGERPVAPPPVAARSEVPARDPVSACLFTPRSAPAVTVVASIDPDAAASYLRERMASKRIAGFAPTGFAPARAGVGLAGEPDGPAIASAARPYCPLPSRAVPDGCAGGAGVADKAGWTDRVALRACDRPAAL